MLHALYLTKNTSSSDTWSVSYANRYVQSETFELERARGKPGFLPAIEGDSAAIIAAYIFNYVISNSLHDDDHCSLSDSDGVLKMSNSAAQIRQS